MARIRTVKPELFRHEILYEAERHYGLPLRLAFIGLFTVSDREGRFKWRPRELKIEILPHDEIDFKLILEALLKEAFIVKFEVDGNIYGCIPTWAKHQVINNREKQSDIPKPVFNNVLMTGDSRVNDASATHELRVIDASVTPFLLAQGERKGREGKGKEDICEVETSPLSFETSNLKAIKIETNSSLMDVFKHWQARLNHPKAKLDKKRERIIKAALRNFSVAELKQAIDGCGKTDFNMGKNDTGQKYDAIDLIFRDAEHIERFISNASANGTTSGNTKDIFAGAI